MNVLLTLHALVSVALLGAVSHQFAALFFRRSASSPTFVGRYTNVRDETFTNSIVVLFLVELVLGALLYPDYRLNVRIPFEEMSLGWAIGLFELKEHWAGIGIGLMPLYAHVWRRPGAAEHVIDRAALTTLVTLIVWWNFIVGHVLNNIRGLE